MASEIKVDTVSEKTSANGVTIDGVNIKDSALVTAGSVPLSTIDIDGGTDIGAAIVDADLFIIDDGAGGTNRKVTASRVKTYAGVSGDVTTIDSLLKADIKIGEDDQTKIDFETADEIHLYAANAEQVYVADGIFGPQTDSDVDLGTTGVRWKDAYIDTITTTGNVIAGGTVEPAGDTAAADNAAIGYTAAEGLILTGQGSTNDITIKRDDDTAVLEVATGQSDIEVTGGNIVFGTADKGVYLGVTSATAVNLLHDYEEGSWTPNWAPAGSGGGAVSGASTNTANYVKIGNQVTVSIYADIQSSGTFTDYVITNLPFSQLVSGAGSAVEIGQQGYAWLLQGAAGGGTFYMKGHAAQFYVNPALQICYTYVTS